MDHHELLASWLHEEAQPFQGWDFSYLDGRMIEHQPPWSYLERAAELMGSATSVLDLDTGGGERFLELRPYWPGRIAATENYPPNARLAHQRLSPLGVKVLEAASTESAALPFAKGAFDLVLNRNSSFNASELARVLTPGGRFLTNQVHGLTLSDLLAVFGASPQWPLASAERYVPLLEAAGLTIVSVINWQGKLHFSDVGALVYFLRAVPWLVSDFNVTTYQDVLFSLQKQVEGGSELSFAARAYLIEAHNERE